MKDVDGCKDSKGHLLIHFMFEFSIFVLSGCFPVQIIV